MRDLTHAALLRSQFKTITSSENQQPQGYIVSNAKDLLELFDADFGVFVISEGAKILGPNEHGQEVLVIAEYLRLKALWYYSGFSSRHEGLSGLAVVDGPQDHRGLAVPSALSGRY